MGILCASMVLCDYAYSRAFMCACVQMHACMQSDLSCLCVSHIHCSPSSVPIDPLSRFSLLSQQFKVWIKRMRWTSFMHWSCCQRNMIAARQPCAPLMSLAYREGGQGGTSSNMGTCEFVWRALFIWCIVPTYRYAITIGLSDINAIVPLRQVMIYCFLFWNYIYRVFITMQ